MSQLTPDAWIERNEDDPDDRYFRGGGEPDDIFDAECTRCGDACNSDECNPKGECVNCDQIPEVPPMKTIWEADGSDEAVLICAPPID